VNGDKNIRYQHVVKMGVFANAAFVITLALILAVISSGCIPPFSTARPKDTGSSSGTGGASGSSSSATDTSMTNLSVSPSLWLKAETMSALANGASVSSWTDSSGNAKHATQATAGFQPTYRTNIFNGYPAILFDGTDDYFETPAIDLSTTAKAEVFIAMKNLNGLSSNGMSVVEFSTDYGANTDSFAAFILGGAPTILMNGDVGANIAIHGTGVFEPFIYNALFDKSLSTNELSLNVNAASFISRTFWGGSFDVNNTNAFGNYQFYIGTKGATLNYFLDAYVSEIIVYPTALTSTQRSVVNSYLTAKYVTNVTNNGTATKLAVSGPVRATSGICYGYTVYIKDANAFEATKTSSVIAMLTDSGGGTFYSDSSCTTVTTFAAIATGTTSTTIYFKDLNTETTTITAADASTTLTSASIAVSVAANSPRDVSNLIFWTAANAVSDAADTDTVPYWYDISGNGNHSSTHQKSTLNKPVYRTGMLNTYPVIRFNGTDTFLTTAKLAIGSTTNIEVIAVYDVNGTGVSLPVFASAYDYYPTQPKIMYSDYGDGAFSEIYAYDGTNTSTYTITAGTAGFGIYDIVIDTSLGTAEASIISLNGTANPGAQVSNDDITPGFNDMALVLGSDFNGSFMNGDIAEFMVFKSTLTAGQRTNIINYLKAKYGL